jgi:hypothetical protein
MCCIPHLEQSKGGIASGLGPFQCPNFDAAAEIGAVNLLGLGILLFLPGVVSANQPHVRPCFGGIASFSQEV